MAGDAEWAIGRPNTPNRRVGALTARNLNSETMRSGDTWPGATASPAYVQHDPNLAAHARLGRPGTPMATSATACPEAALFPSASSGRLSASERAVTAIFTTSAPAARMARKRD